MENVNPIHAHSFNQTCDFVLDPIELGFAAFFSLPLPLSGESSSISNFVPSTLLELLKDLLDEFMFTLSRRANTQLSLIFSSVLVVPSAAERMCKVESRGSGYDEKRRQVSKADLMERERALKFSERQ